MKVVDVHIFLIFSAVTRWSFCGQKSNVTFTIFWIQFQDIVCTIPFANLRNSVAIAALLLLSKIKVYDTYVFKLWSKLCFRLSQQIKRIICLQLPTYNRLYHCFCCQNVSKYPSSGFPERQIISHHFLNFLSSTVFTFKYKRPTISMH